MLLRSLYLLYAYDGNITQWNAAPVFLPPNFTFGDIMLVA